MLQTFFGTIAMIGWTYCALSIPDVINSPSSVGNVDQDHDHDLLQNSTADSDKWFSLSTEHLTHRTLSSKKYALYSSYTNSNSRTPCEQLQYANAIMDNTCIKKYSDGSYYAVFAEATRTVKAIYLEKTCSKVLIYETYGSQNYLAGACEPDRIGSPYSSSIQSILSSEVIPLSNPGILLR